ncbi:ABC transporter substrate-binding protein [Cetobacterium sp. SF1]|uniref:ABC transporter substrate-binding protein n=1 Tax=Cetobacterium sp. SF1 TaxID=3417654 RepID=UPI003CF0EF52
MKKYLFFTFTIIFIFAITGCKNENNLQSNNTTLIIAQGGKPKSLDPYTFNEIPALFITQHIYSTLFTKDENEKIIGDLAETWDFSDPLKLKITLKDNIYFHSGEKLTSEDVLFSFNRMKEKPASKIMVEDIKDIEIIDYKTFNILLKAPSAPIFHSLSHPLTAILNKTHTLKFKDEISIYPMGTGPFLFKNFGEGDKIELEAFNKYYKGKSKIQNLIFKVISEPSSRVAALETGEIDIAVGISPIDTQTIEKNKNLLLISKPTTSTEYIFVNTEKKYLNDKNFRKIISMSLDREGIINAIYLGTGNIPNSIFNPNVFGYNSKLEFFKQDIDGAKNLMNNYFKNEHINIKIWTNDSAPRIQIAQILQANLKEININATIEILEWGTYLQQSALGEHDLLLGGWVSGTGDGDIVLYPLIHSMSKGGAGNRAFYENKYIDNLIEMGRKELNIENRIKIYENIQEKLNEDLPLIPVLYKNENIGINKKVKNFIFSSNIMHNLYNISKED